MSCSVKFAWPFKTLIQVNRLAWWCLSIGLLSDLKMSSYKVKITICLLVSPPNMERYRKKEIIFGDYLPWTAIAWTPVFSIRLASSTVSCGDFRSRILHVTGRLKFLRNVVKIWIFKEEGFKHVAKLQYDRNPRTK